MIIDKPITKLKECEDYNEANRYLEGKNNGEWVLLKVFVDTQKCFKPTNNDERPIFYEKLVKLYKIGKIKE